jgi:type IV secretory pathway TraG/TraD family ATPase VirD4
MRRPSPIVGGLLLLAALLLVRAALAPDVPLGVWLVGAPALGGLIWLGLVVVAGGTAHLPRPGVGAGGGAPEERRPMGTSTPGEAMRAETARLGGGAYVGSLGGHWVTADPESAVMVLGPPRRGKTSAVMIPAVMAAAGAVVSTSTKPDVMRATVEVRAEVGQTWLFDPLGSEACLPGGVRRLSWSPVAAAGEWDGALVMARAMTRVARAGAGTTDESHWSERAAALLAPLIHAAAVNGRPIGEVVRWVLRQDLRPAMDILRDADSELAADVLAGIEATDSRERSSIFSAGAGVLAAYNSDAVRDGARAPNFDPDGFAAGRDTIYVSAPEQAQSLCAPLIVGLLEQVRQAVYARAAAGEAEGAPMLLALDEVANVAPIHDLPALVSQAGGQGLQVMIGLQDLSQVRLRWGAEVAEGFMSLFQTKVVLPGIGDPRTLESISLAVGEYDRQVVSRNVGHGETDRWLDHHQYNDSVSWQTQRQRVLEPGDIAKVPAGRGLLLVGAEWGLVGLPRWFEAEPWKLGAVAPEGLIHQASDGTMVRSKSELLVLETLLAMGLEPRYEERLYSPVDPDDFRLPDFTITHNGVTFYWEHLGMLDKDHYARAWRRKREWYERHGFVDRLITSADEPGVGLSVPEVRARVESRILRGEARSGEPGI